MTTRNHPRECTEAYFAYKNVPLNTKALKDGDRQKIWCRIGPKIGSKERKYGPGLEDGQTKCGARLLKINLHDWDLESKIRRSPYIFISGVLCQETTLLKLPKYLTSNFNGGPRFMSLEWVIPNYLIDRYLAA